MIVLHDFFYKRGLPRYLDEAWLPTAGKEAEP